MWYVRLVKCDTRKYCLRNGEVSHQREENNTELETMQREGNVHEQGTTEDHRGSIPQGTLGDKQDTSKLSHPRKQGSWDVCPSTPICHWLTAVPQELEQDLYCEPLLLHYGEGIG